MQNKEFKTPMTEEAIAETIQKVIVGVKKAKELRKFFANDLKRLEELFERVGNVETRIAIIGITSSGKSTLMNAVLGKPLLPTRVGPSSSKQVLCGWDEKCEAEIIFDPETEKPARTVIGEKEIPVELEKYGDEKFNPGNREGVDEIRVHAPGFKFDKNLVIIDTPGLDAYGLDQHKEVTMKLVLPTVDMVMFLTNVKCDSDRANLEFIDNVTTDDKPLIVVQNKIDSIEAKISRSGIQKTVEEVRLDHLHRIKRLLAGAKKASVRNAPVVQVSAKAKSWKASNLGELGDVLDRQIKLNSKFRVMRRARQFVKIVAEMMDVLHSKLADVEKAKEIQRRERGKYEIWKNHLLKLEKHWSDTTVKIQCSLTSISELQRNLLETINDRYGTGGLLSNVRSILGDRKVKNIATDIKRMKESFETQTRELNHFFSEAITETQQLTKNCCTDLNLDFTQVFRSKPFRSANVSIADFQETRTERHTKRVKQSGLGGFLKRFFTFGCCGYEEVSYSETITEYNVGKLFDEIKKVSKAFFEALNQHLPIYNQSTERAVGILRETLDGRVAAFEEQVKTDIPLEAGNALLKSLEQFVAIDIGAENGGEIKNAEVKTTKLVSALSHIDVPRHVAVAAEFAHEHSFAVANMLVKSIVKRSEANRTVICGWDRDKIASLKDWFFTRDDKIEIIDFSKDAVPNAPNSQVCAFCLVNAEQTGSFKGKLMAESSAKKYLDAVKKSGKIVWVMDSVREHISTGSDTFAEAFIEMMKVVEEYMKSHDVFEVMVCDRDLYWTVLVHELYFNRRLFESETVRQNFVNDMAELFRLSNERRHITGNYVAQFSHLRKELKND